MLVSRAELGASAIIGYDVRVNISDWVADFKHYFLVTGGYYFPSAYAAGSELTSFTVSTLTRTTWPTRRTMYSSSSGLLGSLVMPLRLSVLIWYWSMT
jgi:hypothetical protein